MVIDYARNVLGLKDADHEETKPGAHRLVIQALSHHLAGGEHPIRLVKSSKAAAIYDRCEVTEAFYCNFGLNPKYEPELQAQGLTVTGVGPSGEAMIMELLHHPFFLATLFVPQARSFEHEPHPLIHAFVAAADQHLASRSSVAGA